MKAAPMNKNAFDFDAWKLLAESDREAFERQRSQLLQAEINAASATNRPRLRALQWRIDMVRRRYKHPVAATSKLFAMLCDQVYGANGFLDTLTNPRSQLDPPLQRRAAVLPFRAKALD